MLSVCAMGPPSPCPAPFNLAAHVLQGGAAQPGRTALQILHPAHAARSLARYKQPRLYIHIDAIPRSATSKILRRRLRHDWETAYGQA